MLPFNFTDSQSVVVLGLTIVALVFIRRWTFLRPRADSRQQSVAKFAEHGDSLEFRGADRVEKLESRLFDFTREIEGRAQKIAVLDRLIADADREIIRLEQVLAESRRTGIRASGTSRRPDAIVPQARRDAA